MRKIIIISTTNFLVLFSQLIFAQAGSLDVNFGIGGVSVTDIASTNDEATSMVVQSDGKILVAGRSYDGLIYKISIARYETNGDLDVTFGTNGIVITSAGLLYDVGAKGLALQSDGKIIVLVGLFNGLDEDFGLIRFDTNGDIDLGFGTGGIVTTDAGSADNGVFSIHVQTDDKIIATGSTDNLTGYDFTVIRYNSDGSLDNTFNTDGIAFADFSAEDIGLSAATQIDGKIIAVGQSYDLTSYSFAVIRFNVDGTIDNSFSTDGMITTSIGPGGGVATTIAIQSDEKILVGGDSNNGIDGDLTVIRFNSDGSIDNTFDSDGLAQIDFGSNEYVHALEIQNDGKILLAGYKNFSLADIVLARLNIDGTTDNTFDTDGKVTTDNGAEEYGLAMAIQTDGKIIVAGTKCGALCDFIVLRYMAESFTKVDETYLISDINLSPNPTNGAVTILLNEYEESIQIKLMSIDGELLYQENNQSGSTFQIDLSRFPSGIYLIELSTSDFIYRSKVIRD